MCPAGSQRCGVPAGVAGVEKGEEGDEVRAARLEWRESAPRLRGLSPHTTPARAHFQTSFFSSQV